MVVRNLVRTTIAGSAAVVLTLSACSSSKSTGTGPGAGGTSTPPTTSSAASAAKALSLSNGLLVGPNGHTIYFNTVDTASAIKCTGGCASEWPPLTGTVTPGTGLDKGDFGTATRSDGTVQVTYYGHPLYYFAGDTAAGDKKGNELKDEGGEWYATTPSKAESEKPGGDANMHGSSSSSSGSGGYTY